MLMSNQLRFYPKPIWEMSLKKMSTE